MPPKNKVREINFVEESGTFNTFFKKMTGSQSQEDMDFESLSMLRKLLSNEKARLIHTIKTKKPKSIYELAKLLDRDFKSVIQDIKLLQKFGFIEMIAEKSGKRNRLRPVISVDSITINLKI